MSKRSASHNLFTDRSLLFVTMHGKEQAVAPALLNRWGIKTQIPTDFNTDLFGTFSGDVPRTGNQLDAARAKLAAAQQQFPQHTLFLASEGAFYPHPDSPFLTVNTELLLLFDSLNNWEISAWHTTTDVRAATCLITHASELQAALSRLDFPQVGVVLIQYDGEQVITVAKDFDHADAIGATWQHWRNHGKGTHIRLSHDLRAHRNPTRMAHIREVANILIDNMARQCPACSTPGFSPKSVVRGLPCNWCGWPTREASAWLYECSRCGTKIENSIPDAPTAADPMYCDRCNP